MSLELKTEFCWQPSATLDACKKRASLLAAIRSFFAEREVLEVETPLLSQHTVTDPSIESFKIEGHSRYLQTSPEYAMKRLLAAGSGPIYQICKAFRDESQTSHHNPEFTLLEWYRTDFNDAVLRDEIDLLLQHCIHSPPANTYTYQKVFSNALNLDPIEASAEQLHNMIEQKAPAEYSRTLLSGTKDDLLSLAFSHWVEPTFDPKTPCFVTDFPACQAALARLNPNNPAVACRFELYYQGLELANGFWELTEAPEQLARFEKNLEIREHHNQYKPDIDPNFMAALKAGLPDCAGVALGIDRLLLCSQADSSNLAETLSFDWARA